MKRNLSRLARLVAGMAALAVVAWAAYHFAGRPWIDRWGATGAEIGATLPGDELVAQPLGVVNRAVTIRAAPKDKSQLRPGGAGEKLSESQRSPRTRR